MRFRVDERNTGTTADGRNVVMGPDEGCGEPSVPFIDPEVIRLLQDSEELLNRFHARGDSELGHDAASLSGRIGRTLEGVGA